MKTMRFLILLVVIFMAMLLAACAAPAAAPTATPIPPTAVPPTDTPVPPTATPVPPTATPLPTTEDTSEVISGYADNDGVKIYYEVEGEGPPLMLVHWASGSTADWRMFGYVDALKEDYQLIMVDMRGHGQSDKPDKPSAYDAEIQVTDIVAVLDELDIDKTHFFGYSLGAKLGWTLAKYAPERFHSFIIGGHTPSRWDDSEWASWVLDNGVVGMAHMIEDFARDNGMWHPDIFAAYENSDLEAVVLNSGALFKQNHVSDLPDMQMPFLLLVGREDPLYLDISEVSNRLPNAKLAPLHGLDHGQGFVVSDQALPHITEFLAEVSAEDDSPAVGLDSETVAEIEALVEDMMAENEIPGYALGIVMDGKIVYTQGFGVERVGADKPVTPHTVFGTGSVGKTATATAIMQLVAEGVVDLEASVTDYLPYFTLADERHSDITVYDLVTSRSGLPEVEDWFPLPVEYDDGVLERYVRSLDGVELLFAPSKQWSYSSMGFTVLADIVAKVSGQTFEDYVQEHIIDPLGMNDTLLIVRESDQKQIAGPHVRNDAGAVAVSDIFPYRRQFAAASPLYSSITDMAHYAAAHLNGGEFEGTRILPETVYDVMWEPISYTHWRPGPVLTPLSTYYGMGWAIGKMDDHRIVNMLGSDKGYVAALALAPEDNVAVVMAANYFDYEEVTLSPGETAVAVLDMLLNK